MPGQKKSQKKTCKYTPEKLLEAINLAKNPENKLSIRKIAKQYGIPFSTLNDRISGM